MKGCRLRQGGVFDVDAQLSVSVNTVNQALTQTVKSLRLNQLADFLVKLYAFQCQWYIYGPHL